MVQARDPLPASSEIKPYLSYSFGLHLALALAFLKLFKGVSSSSSAVYTIDFVGPSAAIVTSVASEPAAKTQAAPETAAAKPPPQAEFDEFGRRKRRHGPFSLPRPSLLRGFHEKAQPAPGLPKAPTSMVAAEPAAAGSPGGAGVATDMPNFPYPWYISQVRSSLWNQWSSRMPKDQGECVVVFSLMPNGSVVDLRTEVSSGDAGFDLTALSAVQDAGPYPPLPKGFREPFLKIHVTLKSL